jgi:signal transduction histidine kinase
VVLEAGPWWTTRRILSLVLILAVGLVVALGWAALLRRTVGQRTTQLKREIEARQLVEQRRVLEEERSRVAQDLHDDLGAGLAELAMLGALANNPSIHRDKQTGYLQRLAELARLLVTGLDEIVWAINPRHDSHASVTSYLCDYAQEFLHSTEVRCRIDASRDVPGHAFNAHQRHQLFLAFKEALTNVVKHAQATEVWVRIGSDDGVFWVAVEDNGRGLQTNEARQDGDGLANMRKRM